MLILRCKTLLLLVLFLLPLFACKNRGEASSPVLVRVDGRAVTLDQFRREFALSLPPGQDLSAEEKSDLERSFLVQIIDRELTLAEAERLGIKVSPEEVAAAVQEYRAEYPEASFEDALKERGITLEAWQGEVAQGVLVEKVMRQAVDPGLKIEEAEIEAYFMEHRDEFDRPAQVRARQIVVAKEEEGQQVLGQLRQGRSFAEIAREVSLSPDAEEGGDLGFFSRGEMPPEFDAVVFNLAPGRLSELIKSEYGYHIFLVEERREAQRLTLSQVHDEIHGRLLADRQEQAYQKWLQELRGKATIEMNWSLL